MKENFFYVGHSTYFSKPKKENWTSILIKKVNEHKIIFLVLFIILACSIMNLFLIYKFMSILGNI